MTEGNETDMAYVGGDPEPSEPTVPLDLTAAALDLKRIELLVSITEAIQGLRADTRGVREDIAGVKRFRRFEIVALALLAVGAILLGISVGQWRSSTHSNHQILAQIQDVALPGGRTYEANRKSANDQLKTAITQITTETDRAIVVALSCAFGKDQTAGVVQRCIAQALTPPAG